MTKEKIAFVMRDEMVGIIVAAIVRSAHTGRPGDGKVLVAHVDRAIRIQTGEKDDDAV